MADISAVNAVESMVSVSESETNDNVSHSNNILTNRRYIMNAEAAKSTFRTDHKFSVTSYNILAQCHMTQLGAAVYPDLAKKESQQEFRHELLMHELHYLNSDIICLQECGIDYYNNTLEPVMKRLGYGSQFMKRLHDRHPEGEATFYRLSRFQLVTTVVTSINDICYEAINRSEQLDHATKASLQQYLDTSEIILITKLRCKQTGKELTVGNVHIQWTSYKKLDLQCIQVACAVNKLVEVACHKTYILTGDFNSLPTMAPCQLARDGYVNDEMKETLGKIKNVVMLDGTTQSLLTLWPQGFRHIAPRLWSVYAAVMDREPEATTVDVCGPTPNECVDYIFCSPQGVAPIAVLDCHKESVLQKIMPLPNEIFPSDHVSIKADLAFT